MLETGRTRLVVISLVLNFVLGMLWLSAWWTPPRSVDWPATGSLAELIAAVGTVAAFFAGIRLLRKELEDQRRQIFSTRAEQASKFAVYVHSNDHESAELRVINAGDLPIFNLRAIVGPENDIHSYGEIVPPRANKTWRISLSRPIASGHGLGVSVEFCDAANVIWHRLDDGSLEEVVRDRVSALPP